MDYDVTITEEVPNNIYKYFICGNSITLPSYPEFQDLKSTIQYCIDNKYSYQISNFKP